MEVEFSLTIASNKLSFVTAASGHDAIWGASIQQSLGLKKKTGNTPLDAKENCLHFYLIYTTISISIYFYFYIYINEQKALYFKYVHELSQWNDTDFTMHLLHHLCDKTQTPLAL